MTQEATNKAKVGQFYRDVLGRGDANALDALCAETYMPRCAPLKDVATLPGGLGALKRRIKENGPLEHKVYRVIADGDHVYAHVRYDTHAMPIAGIDIFRFDTDGRIAEHWNARQRIPNDAKRGVDRFAGGGTSDLPTTAARRAEMKKIMTDVLLEMWAKGDADLVPVYYDKSYIQHNPDMPGGYQRILEVVEQEIKKYIAANKSAYPVNIHLMGAEGDLIVIYYSNFMAGINRASGANATNADIFRVDAKNKMIEHWDVLQIEGEPLPDDASLF